MQVYTSAFMNTNGVAFPSTAAINASGAGATDGTEFIKALVDEIWGVNQAIMNAGGLTPNGVQESYNASQIKTAMQNVLGGPGEGVHYWCTTDPATLLKRLIKLNGQGVLRANYPDLDTAVYCGDANNATAAAFYHATDSAGVTRSTSGAYLILPETRGYFLRGLDVAASIDPQGASRSLGHKQTDAFQDWQIGVDNSGTIYYGQPDAYNQKVTAGAGSGWAVPSLNTGYQSATLKMKAVSDGVNGTPRVATETRPVNVATHFAIRY